MTSSVPGPGVIVNADGSWDLPCRLRFQNPLDLVNTGVGTLTVLPAADGTPIAESIAQFVPLLGRGPQGFTPNINEVENVIELAPGATPPSGTPYGSWAQTDPGNETTPPTWQHTIYIHRGNDGTFVMPNLDSLANVTGTLADGRTVYYNNAEGEWVISDPKITQYAVSTNLTAAAGTAAVPIQQLGTLTLAAASYSRNPFPHAELVVNPPADGSALIKIYARAGSATGPIIGQATALPGATVPYIANLIPNAAAGNPSNAIAAGSSLKVYLNAECVVGGASNWSTTMTDASFFAYGIPN